VENRGESVRKKPRRGRGFGEEGRCKKCVTLSSQGLKNWRRL